MRSAQITPRSAWSPLLPGMGLALSLLCQPRHTVWTPIYGSDCLAAPITSETAAASWAVSTR